MQQVFHTRNYSIRDFEEWDKRGELVLQPKFQRRPVWSDKARSYLIDTILRGKPIPKIYMRQDVNPKNRKTVREVVDGQQRLHTVLSFLRDGFKISRAHHADFRGKTFSGLDEDTQRDLLKYEFVVDLLQDMPDSELFNVFARLNTFSERLKPQELRNAQWFGDFKSCVYQLAEELTPFFIENKILTQKAVLRMAEAEYLSHLLLAMQEGIQEGSSQALLNNVYEKYDDEFPSRTVHERRLRETIDIIKAIFGGNLSESAFRAARLFYPLFCAIYHLKHGLPKLRSTRQSFRASDYPKMETALDYVDNLLERIAESGKKASSIHLSQDDRKFWDAYREHWVHVEERTTLTDYICRRLVKAING
jgi:hypothetical protein